METNQSKHCTRFTIVKLDGWWSIDKLNRYRFEFSINFLDLRSLVGGLRWTRSSWGSSRKSTGEASSPSWEASGGTSTEGGEDGGHNRPQGLLLLLKLLLLGALVRVEQRGHAEDHIVDLLLVGLGQEGKRIEGWQSTV